MKMYSVPSKFSSTLVYRRFILAASYLFDIELIAVVTNCYLTNVVTNVVT